jgi:hypothetical protein
VKNWGFISQRKKLRYRANQEISPEPIKENGLKQCRSPKGKTAGNWEVDCSLFLIPSLLVPWSSASS